MINEAPAFIGPWNLVIVLSFELVIDHYAAPGVDIFPPVADNHLMARIKVGIIGGSGLGKALAGQTSGTRHDVETPFGKPSDMIVETEWGGVPVFFLSRHGPGHLLNPSQVPYRANIFALKQLGVTHILAGGAVGSLREEFKPRDLVVPDQIIDRTSKRDTTFYDRVAVHAEFAEPFCPYLRQLLLDAGEGNSDLTVHSRGCYVAMEGPTFSTRAESLMHRLWGGDLIGMTAMPEAKLAREAEIAYALVALVTDYDCWRQQAPVVKKTQPTTSAGAAAAANVTATAAPKTATPEQAADADQDALLKEIIANLDAATTNAITLMRRAVDLMAGREEELMSSPALHALRLGIWSDKSQIDPDYVRLLAPLWIKYFEENPNDEIRNPNQ